MIRNVLIVEDQTRYQEKLKEIIVGLEKNVQIFCADSIENAYQILAMNRIHIFLVDIMLDSSLNSDVSGLELAERIRKMDRYRNTPIIFITSLEDPKLFTLSKLHCFDYIEKPFCVSRVRDALLSALELPIVEEGKRSVYFRKDGIIYAKKIEEIVYIENSHRELTIFCVNDKLTIGHKTTKEIMKQIDSEAFIECSRFHVINRRFIEQIDYTNRFVKMKYYTTQIEIGRKMLGSFRRKMEHA